MIPFVITITKPRRPIPASLHVLRERALRLPLMLIYTVVSYRVFKGKVGNDNRHYRAEKCNERSRLLQPPPGRPFGCPPQAAPVRCGNRGIQETTSFLGTFCRNLPRRVDSAQLDRFEALLDCADADLFDWIAGRTRPPAEHDHDVMRLLRSFRYAPGHSGRQQNGELQC